MNWSFSECKKLQPARLAIWLLFIRCDNPGQAELLEIEELSWAHRKGKGAPRGKSCNLQMQRRYQASMLENWSWYKRGRQRGQSQEEHVSFLAYSPCGRR
jgi:hypothetical protein